jgi:hypothetical protein
MSRFLTPLRAEKSGDYWTILQPLVYMSDLARNTFVVPEGFVTDFASVPRLPLMFLLAGNEAHEAAVVHDWLYSKQDVPRSQADAIFKEAMGASGEPGWRSWFMWAGVRAGGWMAWNNKQTQIG